MATTNVVDKVSEKVSNVVTKAVVETTEPGLSAQGHATFYRFSTPHGDGANYMDKEQFVEAVAPPNEDFVRV
jgi:hypothetical protein